MAFLQLKGIVKEWDLAKGTVAREFDAKALYKYDPSFRADIGGIRAIAFSADGNLLACGGITDVSNAFAGVGKPAVVLVDWATGKSKPLVRPKEEFQGVVGTTWSLPPLDRATAAGMTDDPRGRTWCVLEIDRKS